MKTFYFSKKYLLFGIITFLFLANANGQYSFSPSTTLIKNQPLDTLTYDSIHIANGSASTLLLDWQLISSDTTGGSYFDFCTSGNCFFGIPNTGSFPAINPGEFGWIGMHFWTGHIPGTSTAKIWMFEKGNPSIGDTLTFILNASGTNGIANLDKSDQISIGPNPSKGIIEITNMKDRGNQILIYNRLGQKVFSLDRGAQEASIDLSSFPNGIYFIEVSHGNDSTFRKIILNK